MWGADWKFHHESNRSASQGLPSDVERLSRSTEFSVRTEQPLQNFRFFFLRRLPSTIVFELGYALFYQFYADLNTFSIKEMFGSAPIYDVLASCMWASYTPWYKTEISRTGENWGKPWQVCKNHSSDWSLFQLPIFCEQTAKALLSLAYLCM